MPVEILQLPQGIQDTKSYCKTGENIYPTGKEGEGAILCFIHQVVLGKGKMPNCSLPS